MYTRFCFYLYEKLNEAMEDALERSESGQGMVEYALLAGFAAFSAGAAFAPLSGDIVRIWVKIGLYVAMAAGVTQIVSC